MYMVIYFICCLEVRLGVDGCDEDCGVLPWELGPKAGFESEKSAEQISVQGGIENSFQILAGRA